MGLWEAYYRRLWLDAVRSSRLSGSSVGLSFIEEVIKFSLEAERELRSWLNDVERGGCDEWVEALMGEIVRLAGLLEADVREEARLYGIEGGRVLEAIALLNRVRRLASSIGGRCGRSSS